MTLAAEALPSPVTAREPGPLDGLTILRFAHAYDKGAGLEYDVESIIRALAERSKVTTIYVHMAASPAEARETTQNVGLGKLVRHTIHRPIPPGAGAHTALAGEGATTRQKMLQAVSGLPDFLFRLGAAVIRPRSRATDVPGASDRVQELMDRYEPDLVMLHSIGGKDSFEICQAAAKRGIPVLLQLHFANDRYTHFAVRCQVAYARGVSGVSDLRVPGYLRGRFTNLLTGVDLTEFQTRRTSADETRVELPTLLLPARIVPSKGHTDLLQAVAQLRKRGVDCRVTFPGRADDPNFLRTLKELVQELGLEDRVEFPGLLNQQQMRDCYGRCAALAFPTYHHEGLPRIILEAQAMSLPVIVYDSGGSAAALNDGVTGHVVKPGDIDGLVERIAQLVKNPDDGRRMGRAGRAFVEKRFSLSALAERHEDFYRKILGTQRKPASARVESRPVSNRGEDVEREAARV